METYFHYHEAKYEAERLSRVLNRDVAVLTIACPCDYARDCGRCGGEGRYYMVDAPTVVTFEHAPLKSCRDVAIEEEEKEDAPVSTVSPARTLRARLRAEAKEINALNRVPGDLYYREIRG